MMYFIIILFVLGLVAGHREVEILVKASLWTMQMTWLKFWKNLVLFGKEIKNTDSFHFMNGLWWLIVILFIIIEAVWVFLYGDLLIEVWLLIVSREAWWVVLSVMLNVVIYWQTYMWFRNISMHIVFIRSGHRQWKYIFPLVDLLKLLKGKK